MSREKRLATTLEVRMTWPEGDRNRNEPILGEQEGKENQNMMYVTEVGTQQSTPGNKKEMEEKLFCRPT
jgi:hypothetical protein